MEKTKEFIWVYKGCEYPSKKDLRTAHNMGDTTFKAKHRAKEIIFLKLNHTLNPEVYEQKTKAI